MFTNCNQNSLEYQEDRTDYEVLTLSGISISPDSRSLSDKDYVITFMNYNGKQGLSINASENDNGRYSCDYDKNGTTDFYVKFLPNGHILYEDVNLNPLKEIIMKSDGNKYYMNVLKVYSSQSRAIWGNGEETVRECFERRMSSAEGIVLIATGGAIANGLGALAVCVGGALSCVLYNPF